MLESYHTPPKCLFKEKHKYFYKASVCQSLDQAFCAADISGPVVFFEESGGREEGNTRTSYLQTKSFSVCL